MGNPSPSPSPAPSPTPNPSPTTNPTPTVGIATPKVHHPHVTQSFPTTSGVAGPQWSPVAVESGANLVYDSDTLRSTFAPNLSRMGGVLNEVATKATSAAAAGPAIAAIPWGPVQTLSSAVSTAHTAITGYTGGLAVAHDANATNLKTAADIYDDADSTVANSSQTPLQGLQTTWQSSPTSATAKQTTLVMYGGAGDTSANITASQYSDVMRAVDHMPGGAALLNQPSWPPNAKGKTYQVPVSEQNWPHSSADVPSTVTLSDLQTLLSPSNIDAVQQAATAHRNLADALGDAATNLQSLGPQIASSWKGSGAVGMVTQVQSMYQTAQGLQQNAAATSQTLNWYGTVMQSFAGGLPQLSQQLQTPGLSSSQQNTLTKQYLQQMNPYVQTAYYNLPPSVNSTVLPSKPGSASGHSTGSSSGSGSGLPGAGSLSGVGSTGSGGGASGGVGGTGGTLPPGTTPISVASTVPPVTTTSTTTPPVTTPPVTTPTTVPPVTMPAIPGGSSGSGSTSDDVGDTGLGDSGVGSDGGLTDFPGVGGLGTTSALGSGNGVGADDGVGTTGDVGLAGDGVGTPTEGLTGFPGMGGMGGLGGAGTGSTGRVRQAWESEEDGVWDPAAEGAFADAPAFSGDGMIGAADGLGAGGSFAAGGFGGASGGSAAAADSTTAGDEGMFPFMGGGAGAGTGGGQDRNGRQRQAWMSEDADVWEPGDGGGVPPVIG